MSLFEFWKIFNIVISNALMNLGVSINVMSYSLYKMLHLGELKSTDVIIQLANRNTAQPLKKIKDVLIYDTIRKQSFESILNFSL